MKFTDKLIEFSNYIPMGVWTTKQGSIHPRLEWFCQLSDFARMQFFFQFCYLDYSQAVGVNEYVIWPLRPSNLKIWPLPREYFCSHGIYAMIPSFVPVFFHLRRITFNVILVLMDPLLLELWVNSSYPQVEFFSISMPPFHPLKVWDIMDSHCSSTCLSICLRLCL